MHAVPLRRTAFATLVFILSSRVAWAQAVAPAAQPPADPLKDQAVVLSPFEVGAEADHGYAPTALRQGGRGRIELADVAGQVAVFTKDLIETWLDYKRSNEIDALRKMPHPYEFALYHDG